MINFEEEYKRLTPVFRKISSFALIGKKIEVKGEKNFIRRGPNLIVGNHIGTFKDAATFFKIAPKQLFPTSNKVIFDKKEFNLLSSKDNLLPTISVESELKKFSS